MNRTATAALKDVIHASPIFTTRDAAAAAGVSPDAASRDLAVVAKKGIITRLTPGIWADTRHPDFSAYAVVPYLLRTRQGAAPEYSGYVSLLSALNLRGMIQQIPRVIQVVVTVQRRPIVTPVGTYEFHMIDPAVFGGSEPFGRLANFEVASPTKAIFDVLYLSVRRARRFRHLPELEIGRDFKESDLVRWIQSIPYPPVRTAVMERWLALKAGTALAVEPAR